MATDETALVCYLDDSGKDPQNVATTLAGYVAEKGSASISAWFMINSLWQACRRLATLAIPARVSRRPKTRSMAMACICFRTRRVGPTLGGLG